MTVVTTRRTAFPDVDSVAIAILIAAVTAFFFDVLFLGSEICFRDLLSYFYPVRKVLHDVVASGAFPLWNRAWSAGQPLAANPAYEVFYPPQWLTFLPNFDFGFRLHLVVHFYVAAAGMYALLRDLRLRAAASLFGAFSFALGGPLVSLLNLPPLLFAWAWLPLIVMFARRTLLAPSLRAAAAVVLLLGLQLLTGEPVTILQTWVIVAAMLLLHVAPFWRDSRRALRFALGGATLFAAAACVAAVQLIPAIDHVAGSSRGSTMAFSMVEAWSMPPHRIVEVLLPSWMGVTFGDGAVYWGSNAYGGLKAPYILSIYAGLAAAVFAIAGFATRRRGWRVAAVAGAASYLVAIGSHTPLLRLLYETGIFSLVRFPEKMILAGLFVLTVFAATVLDGILDGDRRLASAAGAVAGIVTALMLAMALATLAPPFESLFRDFWRLGDHPLAGRMVAVFREGALLNAGRAAALCAIAFLAFRGRMRVCLVALASFVAIDLVPVASSLFIRVSPSLYTQAPPVTATLAAGGDPGRIFHAGERVHSRVLANYFVIGEPVYWLARNGLYARTPAIWGFDTVLEQDYDATILRATADFHDAVQTLARRDGPWRETVLAMSNVAWYGLPIDPSPEAVSDAAVAARTTTARFLRIPANPRYYFADSVVQAGGKDAFVRAMSSVPRSRRVAFVSFAAFAPAPARVLAVRESANDATIDVDASGVSLLVMSVTPHKYWKATIDGSPAQLAVVNLGYQGLVVPGGRHRIAMRYRNPLIGLGGAVSLLTIAACVVVFATGGRRRSR